MTKLFLMCVRRDELSKDEYARLLLEDHAPRVLDRLAGIDAFAVNIVDEAQADFPAYDSISEISFAAEAKHKALERALGKIAAVVHAYTTSEFVARDDIGPRAIGAFGGIKTFYPIVRKDGTSHDEFVRHWREVHVPKAARHHPGMHRYVQNVVTRRLSNDGEDWDGFTEGYYPSAEDYTERLFDSPEGMRVIMDDVAQFIGRVGTYRVTEHVLR